MFRMGLLIFAVFFNVLALDKAAAQQFRPGPLTKQFYNNLFTGIGTKTALLPDEDATCNQYDLYYLHVWCDFNNAAIGSTAYQSIQFPGSGMQEENATYTVEFESVSLEDEDNDGIMNFAIVSDTCSGVERGFDEHCTVRFSYSPTNYSQQVAYVNVPVKSCVENHISHVKTCTSYLSQIFYLNGHPKPVCPKCEGIGRGSLINIDSQSVIETMPIVGTSFYLTYSSRNAVSYVDPFQFSSKPIFFNENGLSVSVQHYYDSSNASKFYGGDGFNRSVAKVSYSSNYLVVGDDEIYLFSGSKHIETKTKLTGATKLQFNYDSNDRLASIVDAFGNTTTFARDSAGKLTSITAPFGQVTTITTNSSNLVTAVQNPNGETHNLTYKSGTDLLETFTKPGGQVTTLTYDSNGRLTKDEGHGGDYSTLSKNSSLPGKPVTLTSKMGRSKVLTSFVFGSGKYENELAMPDGDVKGSVETPNGAIATFDNRHRIGTLTIPDERFGNADNRVSTINFLTNSITRSETIGQTVAYGTGITPGYFNFDSITKTRTFGSSVRTKVFNASTKTWTDTSDEGATRSIVLNSHEQPVSLQIGNDTAWTFSYDSFGRLDGMIQGSKNQRTISYNSAGYISSVENALAEETSYTYDLSGRVTQITLPDLRVISYSYDANGNLSGVTPPSRPQHGFSINNFELVSTYSPPAIGIGVTKNTTYAYNDDRQLTNITRPDGAQVNFTYDSATGQLTTIGTPGGSYNLVYSTVNQNLLKKKNPSGIRNDFTFGGLLKTSDSQVRASDDYLFGKVSFAYDSYHRRSSRTIQGNSSGTTSTIGYTYNDDEKPTQVGALSIGYTYPSGRIATTSVGQISDSRAYDAYGNLITYTAIYTPSGGGASTTLYTYTLTWDNMSRIIGKTETIQGTTSVFEYYYDSAGRLTSVEKNNVVTDSFVYDSNSNRTSGKIAGTNFTATFDDQDRILTLGSRTYTHNRNGDLTQIQWNVSQQSTFVYDVMGNLEQVTTPTSLVEFVADGLDRRAVKKVGGSFIWRYIYEDQYRVAALINGSSAISKEFVYATRVNVPDYMVFGGITYRIITDHLGSPRLVVKVTDGTVSQRMDYTTLGAVASDSNSGFQPFGFAGGIYDAAVELVRFGARDYDPRATGRWTTKDPIRFRGGDVNLFGYVLSNPVNRVDPSGLRNDCNNYDMNRDISREKRNELADKLDKRKTCPPEDIDELDEEIDEIKRVLGDIENEQRDANDGCNSDPKNEDPLGTLNP